MPVERPRRRPLAPKWVHPQRRAGAPARLLAARALAERAGEAPDCAHHAHRPLPEQAT
ncbi:MAG TPA: hypothetical protein VFW96_02865 [Thermomicrobiales bacterium]|nr:hypothetical protein [Thermomicrobiales bacterium]